MSEDARFSDGALKPLRLAALDAEDVQVISALAQDAVFPVSEMAWDRTRRRFALLINRFRWEDRIAPPLRVQSVLAFEDVAKVATLGIDRSERDMVLSLLAINWDAGADGAGQMTLTLAGDGAIALDVDCINVSLRDVTQAYPAPSGKTPRHPD